MTVTVQLKWRGTELSVQCPCDATNEQLATLIFEQTRVPLDRQILMAPGLKLNKAILTNAESRAKLVRELNPKFTPGASIKGTLVGTPVGDEFVSTSENSGASQMADAAGPALGLPRGYVNIGNTCYLGSVLAMLEQSEGFRDFLTGLAPEQFPRGTDSIPGAIAEVWKNRFRQVPKSLLEPVRPNPIFRALCNAHPDFGERAPGSFHPRMQDAEECLSRLFQAMSGLQNSDGQTVSSFFDIGLEEETVVNPGVLESLGREGALPEPERGEVTISKLSCYMGTLNKSVSFLLNGVELALEEEIEKHVETLNQSVVCNRKRRITSLPRYLIVHMVRFEWKKANALAGSKAGRAKVLKKVEYPNTLDLWPLSSTQLQDHLRVGRQAEQTLRDKELEQKMNPQGEGEEGPAAPKAVEKQALPCSGKYNLKAVVTHTGRSAIDGHYICWVWKGTHWIKMDDDKSSIVEADKINLQGGIADGPCPYILLYEREGDVSESTISSSVEGGDRVDPPSKNRRLEV